MARGGAAPESKVLGRTALARRVAALRRAGKRIVFTNGCFDILHVGHARYLRAARKLGDVLIVGVNSDASARRMNKGPGRPVNRENDRAEMLAALETVDYVTLFGEDTPYELVRQVAPDVLVKGGDWAPSRIVGADVVRARGGKVKSLPYAKGYSTSKTIKRIVNR
jgi:D-beta-D-heptose 7-phosphate kinase/D-beta-D-heptose 1-phosphate adenosyltransferase